MRQSALGLSMAVLVTACAPRAEPVTPTERAPGAESASSEPTPDSEPEPATLSAAREPPRTAVLDSWAELEPRVHAVYHATFRVRARRDGQNELCASPDALLAGAGPLPSSEVCTAIASVLGAAGPWPPLATTGAGVAATTLEGAREVVLAAVQDEVCGGDCRAGYEQALWEQVRCGDLARFWSSIPPVDLACSRDDECMLLTAMCFEAVVRAERSAPYRAVLEDHGACTHPAAGACAPSRARAVCRAGACTTAM